MDSRESFKTFFEEALEKAGTLKKLAAALDLSITSVTNWSTKGVSKVDGRNQENLKKLSDYLGMLGPELLFGEEVKEEKEEGGKASPACPTPKKKLPAGFAILDAVEDAIEIVGSLKDLKEQIEMVKSLYETAGNFEVLGMAVERIERVASDD